MPRDSGNATRYAEKAQADEAANELSVASFCVFEAPGIPAVGMDRTLSDQGKKRKRDDESGALID